MKKSNSVKMLTLFALFIAIELMMLMTPLGYLRIGPLSATLLHIPVILAAIFLGTKYGALLGLLFGLSSVWNATMQPTITSFVFSPFVTIGGISGSWTSLIIAIGPRVFLGVFAGLLFQFFQKKMNCSLAAGLSAGIATLLHTIMVLSLIVIFFGSEYSSALGVAQNALIMMLGYTVITNGVMELVLASVVSAALTKAIPMYSKQPEKAKA